MVFKVKDHYFKKAKKENYLARSIYKLEEIDKKFKVLKRGDQVLDLGYYPGSWIQYSSKIVGPSGRVVGVDIKKVNEKLLKLSNISLYEKDVFNINELSEIGVERPFDVVVSDMAPNTTGIKSVDQARSLNLVEKVFEVLPRFLVNDGDIVIKVFESNDAQCFFREQKSLFKKLHFFKPKSTRSVSKEFFAIGKGFINET